MTWARVRRGSLIMGSMVLASSTMLVMRPGLADRNLVQLIVATGVENAYLLTVGVAVVASLQAVRLMLGGLHTDIGESVPELVEDIPAAAVPGDELDDSVLELEKGMGARATADRDRIRDRLRRDVVGALMRKRGITEETARERVEAGTWTTDRYATGFVGRPDAPGPRIHQRILGRVTRTTRFQRQVARTIEAIEAIEVSE